MVGWGVQTIMIEHNIRKTGKMIPLQDLEPMDGEGNNIIQEWVKNK